MASPPYELPAVQLVTPSPGPLFDDSANGNEYLEPSSASSSTQMHESDRRILMSFEKLDEYCRSNNSADGQFSIQYIGSRSRPTIHLTDIRNLTNAWPLRLTATMTASDGRVIDVHRCEETTLNNDPSPVLFADLSIRHISNDSSTLEMGLNFFQQANHEACSTCTGKYIINLVLRDREDGIVCRTPFGKTIHIGQAKPSASNTSELLPHLPPLSSVASTVQDSSSGEDRATSESDWYLSTPERSTLELSSTTSTPKGTASTLINTGVAFPSITPTPVSVPVAPIAPPSAPAVPPTSVVPLAPGYLAQTQLNHHPSVGPLTAISTSVSPQTRSEDQDPSGLDRFHLPPMLNTVFSTPAAVPANSQGSLTVSGMEPKSGFNSHKQMVHIFGSGFVNQQYCLDVSGVRVNASQLSDTMLEAFMPSTSYVGPVDVGVWDTIYTPFHNQRSIVPSPLTYTYMPVPWSD